MALASRCLYALTGIDRFHFKRKDRKRFNGTQRFRRRPVASRDPTERPPHVKRERALSFGPFLLGLLSLGRILFGLLPHRPVAPVDCEIGPNLQRQFCQIFHGTDPLCGGRVARLVIFAYDGRFRPRKSSARGDRRSPARDDERISHSTRADFADSDYGRFLGSASPISFFFFSSFP